MTFFNDFIQFSSSSLCKLTNKITNYTKWLNIISHIYFFLFSHLLFLDDNIICYACMLALYKLPAKVLFMPSTQKTYFNLQCQDVVYLRLEKKCIFKFTSYVHHVVYANSFLCHRQWNNSKQYFQDKSHSWRFNCDHHYDTIKYYYKMVHESRLCTMNLISRVGNEGRGL